MPRNAPEITWRLGAEDIHEMLAECQKAERSDPFGYGYISTEVVRRICKTALDQA